MLKNSVRYLVSALLVLSCTCVLADTRSLEQAEALAASFVQQTAAPARDGNVSHVTLTHAFTENRISSSDPAFYAFDRGDNGGFIIVSADDRTPAILGYTDSGSFVSASTNANFAFWMRRYQEQISAVSAQTEAYVAASTTAIAPLLGGTAWDQESPYNDSLPIDRYDNTRCLTGCVATATAQILFRWKFPAHGIGSKTYVWQNYNKRTQSESLYADFEHTYYDWNSMTETYGDNSSTASRAAVAQLMRHLGIATEMDYGGTKAGGSGSWTDNMALGLEEHFGYLYDKFVTEYSQSGYQYTKGTCAAHTSEWNVSKTILTSYFNADLEAGRPILMGGEDSNDQSGHEFVCDGRDTEGRFHINWGWSGYDNGYFTLSALNCSGYSFSTHIDAIIGLRPGVIDTIDVTGIQVTPKAITVDVNGRKYLTATILPDSATIRTCTWMSSDTTVATVSNGVVRGVNTGNAYIIATSVDGGYSDTCVVTVSDMMIPFTLVTDTIVYTDLTATSKQYTEFSGLTKSSGAVYAGKTATSFTAIQIRNDDGTEGILTTTSPGVLYSIHLVWNTLTQDGRTVSIYGSEYAFANPAAARSATALAQLAKGETEYICQQSPAHFALLADGETASFSKVYVTWLIEGEPVPIHPEEPEPQSVHASSNANHASKIVRNGQILILRDGKLYHILGQRYE